MTEVVRWLPAARAELDAVAPTLRDKPEKELRAVVAAAGKEMAPRWKRGLRHADDEGKAAVALADATLAKGRLPTRPTVDDAARLLSLIGASESSHVEPLGELFVRAHGQAFAVRALARMWSHRSESDNPDWPKSVRRAAIYITAIDDDDDHVHDTSCSYSKGQFTEYLHRRARTGTAGERSELRAAVAAIWDEVAPHVRPALAYVARDARRARRSAEELLHAGMSPYPFWATRHLPELLDDLELLARFAGKGCSLRRIDNVGAAIWPWYVEAIGGPTDRGSRARLLGELANFYGPRTALLLAEYQDTREYAPVVRDYFTRYPELLDKVIGEPDLAYHREDLEKLRAEITAGRPDRGRRRSSRTGSRRGTAASRSGSRTS